MAFYALGCLGFVLVSTIAKSFGDMRTQDRVNFKARVPLGWFLLCELK